MRIAVLKKFHLFIYLIRLLDQIVLCLLNLPQDIFFAYHPPMLCFPHLSILPMVFPQFIHLPGLQAFLMFLQEHSFPANLQCLSFSPLISFPSSIASIVSCNCFTLPVLFARDNWSERLACTVTELSVHY